MHERYLVLTEHGKVLVTVNPDAAHGLADDLLRLEPATPENSQGITMETPLRAFAAKVVDIIEAKGSKGLEVPQSLLTTMKQEKATQELRRITRIVQENVEAGKQ